MNTRLDRLVLAVRSATAALLACLFAATTHADGTTLRVATFNIEDVRTDDLKNLSHPRLRKLAEVIQRIRPNIILLNEMAYDMPGSPGFNPGDQEGQNAQRFADSFLAVAQATDLAPLRFKAFAAPTNTGLHSGMDLDNDSRIISTYPTPIAATTDGSPGGQTPEGRAFGNDCFGFGTFPGQYGMALLVDKRLVIDADNARTFQLLPWDYCPANMMPKAADGSDWYTEKEKTTFRLSSKSHWDVPVKLPSGAVLHLLCSHPTPPAFDGPEQRNKKRNHDEIRFWRDYLDNAPHIVDDSGLVGGLVMGKTGPRINEPLHFVILGDLNADPAKGASLNNPIKNLLFASRHVNALITPTSQVKASGLTESDTASFKLRVDYALPGKTLKVTSSGVWRHNPAGATSFPSDHFPVWIEIEIPAPIPEK